MTLVVSGEASCNTNDEGGCKMNMEENAEYTRIPIMTNPLSQE